MIKLLKFLAIWFIGCTFVDYVVPDIANSYQMAIGFLVGSVGLKVSGWLRD